MSEHVDISPDVLRRHARAVEDATHGLRSQLGELECVQVGGSAFGLLFGWMGEKFDRGMQEVVEGLKGQAAVLGWYAVGLRDTATDFETVEAEIARLFLAGDHR